MKEHCCLPHRCLNALLHVLVPFTHYLLIRYIFAKITYFCIFASTFIPYGAQILMAAGLAGVSSLSVIRYLYYPLIMGLFALGAILFRLPRKYS